MKVEKTRYLIPPTKQDWGELSPKSKPQVPPSPFSSGIHNHQLNKDIIERPLISNSQNLSFKGLSFWYKAPKKYDIKKFKQFTEKYLGNMGDELLNNIKNEKLAKKSVKFNADGTIEIRQKAWGQLLWEGIKYPFTVLPLDIANAVVKLFQKNKTGLKSEFLQNIRKQPKVDANISSLKGLFELEKELAGKPAEEVSTKIYDRGLRMFDAKTGNYDTKHERALNRLVSGLPPAIFLANDAYNLSRIMDDDEHNAQIERKTRFKQETARILSSGYLTLITMGALSKLINNSKAGIMGLTAGTVLITEMFSRLLNGKHIKRISPQEAKAENAKNKISEGENTAAKAFTANSAKEDEIPDKSKKPLLSPDILLKASLTVIGAGFAIKGLRKIKAIDNALIKIGEPFNNLYKKLTVNEHYTVNEAEFKKILDVLRENGFDKIADKYEIVAKDFTKDGLIDLGKKDKKIKPFVNFFITPFKFALNVIKLPYTKIASPIAGFITNSIKKIRKIEKPVVKKEVSVNQKNQQALQKINDYIGKQALKQNMNPEKFKEFVNNNILRGFNEDTLSNLSNSDLSNLAKTSATAATLWFLMTDNYNMVMLKSNGEDVEGAQTKFKERFVQEISRLFYQTLLIDLFNSTFRAQYNKSLLGMSWITVTNTTLGEILTRKSVGTPIKPHTRAELEAQEERQNNATGFKKSYYTFMKRLTGKRSIHSYNVHNKKDGESK